MARKPATLGLSSNIELRAAAPLDGRQKVETLADLTAPESFPYHYVGMETYCVEAQKWYTLRYDDPTDINNWVESATGADGKDGLSVAIDSVSKQGRENTVTFVWKDPDGSDKSIDLVVLDGMKGDIGLTGERGPKGDDGRSFSIQAQYSSEEAMREAHPTGSEGDAYLVDNETDTPDLWYWNVEESDWYCYGPLAGARGERGEQGPAGFSPDITVAETSDGSYKLRVTTANGSFVTPNLQGNLAPQDRIDTSANPVQSGTIKTALDAKQDKTLAAAVGVRDYTDGVVKDQTTVQTTLEALAAAVNYMNIPAQLISKVDTAEELPANAKPGSICFVGEEGETPVVYICQDDGTWQKAGGTSDDNLIEFDANEIDEIWDAAGDTIMWLSGTALPEDFGSFGACIYDGKINILGGYMVDRDLRNTAKFHYQLNNGTWESVSTLPHSFSTGAGTFVTGQAVVYDDKIYTVNGGFMDSWDGTSWSNVAMIPFYHKGGGLVVYNDEMYLVGGENYSSGIEYYENSTKLRKWNGTEWVDISEIPVGFELRSCIVYDNKIHIVTYVSSGQNYGYKHYAWDGSEWDEIIDAFPSPFDPGMLVIYNNKLNAVGDHGRFEYENNTWTQKEKLDVSYNSGTNVITLNGHIHVLGGIQINNVGSPRAHRILQ